jgi:glycerol kinase
MTNSNLTLQLLADVLDAPVERPDDLETTVKGAAYLAGLRSGLCPDLETFAASWHRDAQFEPKLDEAERKQHLARWHDAIERTLSR